MAGMGSVPDRQLRGGKLTVRSWPYQLKVDIGGIKRMRHDKLCAIGHNLADSLASGLCFVIGYWGTDVFGEAAAGDGVIEVDFLNGLMCTAPVRQTCVALLRGSGRYFRHFVLPTAPTFQTSSPCELALRRPPLIARSRSRLPTQVGSARSLNTREFH